MPDATQASAIRRFGAFEINLQSGELRKKGMRLRLSGQPFQVLAVLVERPGEVVTREELHSKLWPADTFVDFDHGLNNAVARIREILSDSSETPRYVETIPRRGYRFIAPLADVSPAAVSQSPAESTVTPVQNATSTGTSRHSVSTVEKRTASNRLRLVLGAVAVLAVLSAGLALYQGRRTRGTRHPTINSLAVLPLKNLSGDPGQEFLADGMTEELIGRLSMIRGLRVISRTSVMGFKDTRITAPEIAKMLHVDALVEGSVVRDGSRVRVHAQLIRGATDEHFWSETYDREMRDALALESDVAQSIAEKVEVTVTGEERSRLIATRQVMPEVYESYLKGMFTPGYKRSEVEKKIAYFQEAINRDPTFAPAYVGLAGAYEDLGEAFFGGPANEIGPKVSSTIRKALELEPQLAEVHVLMADEYLNRWRWADARSEYNLALEMNPNSADSNFGLANWLVCQGRLDDALAMSQRARELDPLGISGVQTAWILFHARRYGESIRELRSVLAVHPDFTYAQFALGHALIGNRQSAEAVSVLEKTAALMDRSPGSLELLAIAYAHAGRRTEALRLINELKRRRERGNVPAGVFINPYLALGEYDEAFVWFERAYQEKSNILTFLKVHPFFDPVRNDPRFADLLHRVGLD